MAENDPQIKFPSSWEYRVFCEVPAFKSVEAGVRAIVAELALDALQCEAGAISKSGSYRALRVTATVKSKEEANLFGEKIKDLPGVKFIL